MRKHVIYYISALACLLFSGCTTTFMGSVFVFNFSNIVSYIVIALAIASVFAFFQDGDWRRNFWTSFVLGLVLTPLASLIYLLVKFLSRK
jgi:uncharacterized protein YybS (DUF2232 family)